MPYLPSGTSGYTCSDAWDISKPVSGPRNWGITDDIASKVDILNIGFATVSYADGYYFTASPDPNADY